MTLELIISDFGSQGCAFGTLSSDIPMIELQFGVSSKSMDKYCQIGKLHTCLQS